MKFRVRITPNAEQDVERVLVWFQGRAADAAGRRWFAQLMAHIVTLETQPQRCPMANEAENLGVEVRELLFGKRQGTYRILFLISGRTVHILRVWHGARDAPTAEDL